MKWHLEDIAMQPTGTNFGFLNQKAIYWKISEPSPRKRLENQALKTESIKVCFSCYTSGVVSVKISFSELFRTIFSMLMVHCSRERKPWGVSYWQLGVPAIKWCVISTHNLLAKISHLSPPSCKEMMSSHQPRKRKTRDRCALDASVTDGKEVRSKKQGWQDPCLGWACLGASIGMHEAKQDSRSVTAFYSHTYERMFRMV